MNEIFYIRILHVCIQLAMTGCCFRGSCDVVTIYVLLHLQIMIGPTGYKTHRKTPCPVLVEFPVSWLVK